MSNSDLLVDQLVNSLESYPPMWCCALFEFVLKLYSAENKVSKRQCVTDLLFEGRL